jgi:hypothetical protein
MSQAVTSGMNSITSVSRSGWSAFQQAAAQAMGSTRSAVQSGMSSMVSTTQAGSSQMVGSFRSQLSALPGIAGGVFSSVNSTIASVFGASVGIVAGIAAQIRSIMAGLVADARAASAQISSALAKRQAVVVDVPDVSDVDGGVRAALANRSVSGYRAEAVSPLRSLVGKLESLQPEKAKGEKQAPQVVIERLIQQPNESVADLADEILWRQRTASFSNGVYG